MEGMSMKRNRLRIPQLVPGTLLGLALVSGCADRPEQDDFRSEGGMAPDPTGVIEGSVLYIGPRPTCTYEDGRPTHILGRVILTMFAYDNPPPPEGRATTAENLLAISSDQVFLKSDCLPEGAEPDLKDPIMRSVAFRWPQIELRKDARDVQIRGFYDYDEDMNPFFSVKNLPTAGDIAGAAIVNLKDPVPTFKRISMPAIGKARRGHLETGVTVALANYVWTERPAFKLAQGNWQLSAEEALPVAIETDPVTRELSLNTPKTLLNTWALTCGTPGTPNCGFALESLSAVDDAPKLAAAGVELDFNPVRYAFNVRPVDIKTVVPGGLDLAQPDGVPDPHPLLGGSMPVPFLMPAVILQRRPQTPEQGKIEAAAKIPSVTLLGAPLPSETDAKQVFVGKMNVAIPPIAVVELDPNNTACRVPYAPPGNSTATYEARVSVCHDLPTGVYGANVLHGIAGGAPEQAAAGTSDNGLSIVGGGMSGQAWSLPNQLADPSQVGDDNVMEHQGEDALFVVHDPRPEMMGDCSMAVDPLAKTIRAVNYKKLCTPADVPTNQSLGLFGTMAGIDGNECLQPSCCENVKHLCNLPPCEVVKVRGLNVRSSPTSLEVREDGVAIPNCMPFEIPELCCNPAQVD
jgi:hypothetical protein